MLTKFALRSILVLCVIVLLSTVMVGSAVTGKESTQPNTALTFPPELLSGGPGYISVSNFGFTPYESTMKLEYSNMWMCNGDAAPGDGIYFAPVNLPHGATITRVLFFYWDSTSPTDMSFLLERVYMLDGARQEVARALPTGHTGYGYIESTLYEPKVDNLLYSYILEASIPDGFFGNLCLINTRIEYDYPVFLPSVQK